MDDSMREAEGLVSDALAAAARKDESAVMLAAARLADTERGGAWSEAAGHVLFTRLTRQVTQAWRRGWQPADLVRVVQREFGRGRRTEIVADMIVAELRTYSPVTVDPAWDGQLSALETKVWWDRDDRYPWLLTDRERADRIIVTCELVDVLHILSRLPSLELLGPVPGEARRTSDDQQKHAHMPRPQEADERLLRRLRAMLAKAESTDFPEEAEALTARAQELMARHSIDQALLAAAHPESRGLPSGRRIGIDNPYESPKAVLLTVVADANRCRSVWSRQLGFCTVLGFPSDLDAVEILFTSLLVQATTAMVAAGSKIDHRGRPRTRAFRHSFLAAYANRIGERLHHATEEATRQAVSETGSTDLVPVLAAREEEVTEAVEKLFPKLVRHRMRNGRDHEGWVSGRAAADLASLHGTRPVEGSNTRRSGA
jgi:hypothetical protein